MFGHHPVWSSGVHGNTPDLIDTLDPVLRRYGVQVRGLVIIGHPFALLGLTTGAQQPSSYCCQTHHSDQLCCRDCNLIMHKGYGGTSRVCRHL